MIAEKVDVEGLPADICRELLGIVDEFLISISNQKLVDSDRAQDFCLDIRSIIKSGLLEDSL